MARGVSVVAWLGRSWGGRVVLGSGVLLGLVSGCPGDDAPAGSGTGGDEDMPDGDDPGPKGAGCVERIAVPPGFWANEGAAAAQPGAARVSRRVMSLVLGVLSACGSGAPDGEGPPGMLEYDHPIAQYYRSERRVDVVAVDSTQSRDGCGFLTDRAYDDLVGTVDALDRSVDYGWSDCFPEYNPQGLLHLDGFDHSPFLCEWYCCHPELIRVATVYFAVGSNLYDQQPNIDDEPYVALEPGMPCPD